jgi:hypothetical protein
VLAGLTLLVLVGAWSSPIVSAQVSETPRPEGDSAIALTCEVFCSPTKLRTTNARICWSLPSSVSTVKQSVEVTVFKRGFEKGLYVTLPLAESAREKPVQPLAQPKQGKLRAYQIQLIDVVKRVSPQTAGAGGGSDFCAVIEGLEPGTNYIWRLVIDGEAGKAMSASTRCQAHECPADMVPTEAAPNRVQ